MQGNIVVADTPEDIKKRVAAQPIIRAELSNLPDKALLSELNELGDLWHEGRIVRLQVENPSESLAPVIRAICSAGLSVESLETGRPSLEEAFVEITGVSPDRMRVEKGGGKR